MNFVITEPLVLASGGHCEGSGYGCAMEVLSWTIGDKFTDFPEGANAALARMVQVYNDEMGLRFGKHVALNGYVLRADHAMKAFEFALLTVGTNGPEVRLRLTEIWDAMRGELGARDPIKTQFDLYEAAQCGQAEELRGQAEELLEGVLRSFRKHAKLDEPTIPNPSAIDAALIRIREEAHV